MDVYDRLPTNQLEALNRYITQGYSPGNFLTAVLTNDLKEAVARADVENQPLIPLYVTWLYNRAPYGCWGSPEAVTAWVTAKRDERNRQAAEEDRTC